MEAFFLDLPLALNLLLVFAALYIVIRSSHYLIDGAVQIAHEFNVSPLVIGATVVAVGTSAAELAVNMAIVLGHGDTTAVVGNILGSNLVNFGIGLGVPALIAGIIAVPRDAFERDIPLYLAATGLLTAFVHDDLISQLEGGVMLIMFLVAIGLIVQYATSKQKGNVLLVEVSEVEAIAHPGAHDMTRRQALIALFGGLIMLIVASRLLIFNTAAVAEALSIPEFVIGLVIVGPGTSLPEIASAVQAARRRQADLVIGMAFGSNLFNLLFGLGLPALIEPLTIETTAVASFTFMDVTNLSLAAILLLDFEWLGRARTINRVVGMYLVLTYLGFIAYEVIHAAGGGTAEWVLAMIITCAASGLSYAAWQWRAGRTKGAPSPTRRILCATRGGQASQPTHAHAIQLAQELNAELIFLYVFDQRVLQQVATPIVIDEDAQIEHMLDFLRTTAQEQAQQAGVHTRVIVRAGRLRDELKGVAQSEHVSLIVLGSPAGSASRFQVAAMLDLVSEIEEATGIEVCTPNGTPALPPDELITPRIEPGV